MTSTLAVLFQLIDNYLKMCHYEWFGGPGIRMTLPVMVKDMLVVYSFQDKIVKLLVCCSVVIFLAFLNHCKFAYCSPCLPAIKCHKCFQTASVKIFGIPPSGRTSVLLLEQWYPPQKRSKLKFLIVLFMQVHNFWSQAEYIFNSTALRNIHTAFVNQAYLVRGSICSITAS